MSTTAVRRQPYPGLRPFRREETDLFFGREDCVDQLIDILAREHFLAVLGSSGGGKSSLVKTGLLEGLDLGLMVSAGSRWRVANFRPGEEPLHRLARCLMHSDERDTQDETGDEDVNMLGTFLSRGPRSLIEWCNDGRLAPSENLLILVDQFEELFRYQNYAGREQAQAFVALLLESSRPNSGVPIYVVLTMRSEFLGACALIEGLAERMTAGQYLTPRMTREQCRTAIEGPAAVCGFAIEPALVNCLLNELESFASWDEDGDITSQLDRLARRADQLPLLQHALNRLWEDAIEATGATKKEQKIVLRLADFEAVGGLQGALNRHADDILAGLGNEQRLIAETVFRALTEGSSAADAIRRQMMFRNLVAIAGGDKKVPGANIEQDVHGVIEAFRARGRNFLLPESDDPISPETWIDISHESVIRQWHQLSEWLKAEAEDARQWRHLIEESNREREGEGGLLEGLALDSYRKWWNNAKPTQIWAERYDGKFDEALSFLDRSKKAATAQQKTRRLRQRLLLCAGAGVAVLLLLFAAFARWEWKRFQKISKITVDTADVLILGLGQEDNVYGTSSESTNEILDQAISKLGNVIEIDPTNVTAYISRGNAYSIKHLYNQASIDYDEAIRLDPNNATALGNRGLNYARMNNFPLAMQDLNKALLLDPTNSKDYNTRGAAYATLGRYDYAFADLDKAISLDPKYAVAYANRGDAYAVEAEPEDASARDADFRRAVADYTKAIELVPKYVFAYYKRGGAYRALGEYDKAIADYSIALGLNPHWFNLYMNRGATYTDKAETEDASAGGVDLDAAIADYTEAIRIDPKFPYTYRNRGRAYHDKGDTARAILDFDKAIGLSPFFAAAYVDRGVAHVDDGDFGAALADFTTAIAIEPRKADGYRQRARGYFVQGNFVAAADDFVSAIESVDNLGPAWDMLWLYLARARADKNGAAELETNAARLKNENWPYPLIELYLGRRSATEVFSAVTKPWQRCDADLFVGEWHLTQRDDAQAAVALQAALTGCSKTNWGYLTAEVDLKRLSK